MKTVAIVLFNEVEVLDFAGPFEVFSLAEKDGEKLFNVVTVTENGERITARNGLKVTPDFSFESLPKTDILIVPGGYGAREIEINNPIMIDFIRGRSESVEIMASVCTGSFLLAKAGLTNGLEITTHHASYDRLEREYPQSKVIRDVKFVDQGAVITSGGISAGINMSFHLLEKLFGVDVARHTAKIMEYDIEFGA